ncbi:MAG: thioredoxin [Clostridia bacterium]|nr:thioredoxin [Clostridia bacterium]
MTDFEIKITDENFSGIVEKSDKPVLVDFYADWCGPCQMLSPIISRIAQDRDDIIVGKVNVDDNPLLTAKFGIMSIPMVAVFKNGEIKAQKVGYCDREEIEDMLV